MTKIAHFADLHIRTSSRHEEYKEIFQIIYSRLREEKIDLILFLGDLYHNKCNLSPEYVKVASDFLKNLAGIAPVRIILGNHDKIYSNNNRLDAVSPIIDAINLDNLILYLKSGEYSFDNNIIFNVMNVFDRENWILEPTDKSKINMALYHGAIRGATTDVEWVVDSGEDEVEIFNNFDYALLGDIHQTQSLDKNGRIRFAGSVIQQNHGESNDKGFLIWDIKDKEEFTVKHITIPNPKPFITLSLDINGEIESVTDVPVNARLRLMADGSLSSNVVKKAIDVAKVKFKPESVTFLNNNKSSNKSNLFISGEYRKEDLRSDAVQEKLIREYLKDYQIKDELYERIFSINKRFNSILQSQETSIRNVFYEIEKLEWDNLFNYGSGNVIDFKKLNGIIGLFGKNFSGKSNAIESLSYTLFNSTSKNSRKKTKIINKDCNSGFGKSVLKVGDKKYTIKRSSEKYIKKLHGEETVEAKTSLDFEVYDETNDETVSLNGVDRIETDKNITKLFGTFDDFILTSMSTQLGSLSYLEKGSTERKEILAKFLDVDIFSEKFDMANKESTDTKAILKKLEGKQFDSELIKSEIELIENEKKTEHCRTICQSQKEKIALLEHDCILLNEALKNSAEEIIDIVDVQSKITEKKKEIENVKSIIKDIEDKIIDNTSKLEKVNNFIVSFDLKSLKEKKLTADDKKRQLDNILHEIKDKEKEIKYGIEKVSILKEVPCGPEYSHCKFIRGAYEAKSQLVEIESLLLKKVSERDKTSEYVELLAPEKLEEQIEKHRVLLEKQKSFEKDINNQKLNLENKKQSLSISEIKLNELLELEEKYNRNKERILEVEKKRQELSIKEITTGELNIENGKCEEELKESYKQHGFINQKIIKLTEDKRELEKTREEYEAYELFMKCMHSNGIAYDIIKKNLPVINEEIAKILSSIVDYQVFFENEDNRLEIYIKKRDDIEVLPIEMSSGSQKNIAAMAIRLAFISISSLPRSNIFILDEPATSFDSDSVDGFIRMLGAIKNQFKCVLLITHLEQLKDAVDVIINIDNNDSFASVRV